MAPIIFSDAVKAFAAEQDGGLESLRETIIEEVRALVGKFDGPEDILDVFFHTVSWHGEYNVLLIPLDDILQVDIAEWEEIEVTPTDGGSPFFVGLPITA